MENSRYLSMLYLFNKSYDAATPLLVQWENNLLVKCNSITGIYETDVESDEEDFIGEYAAAVGDVEILQKGDDNSISIYNGCIEICLKSVPQKIMSLEGVWQYVVQPELEKYTSYIFEDVCRQYLRGQNRTNSLPFRFTKMGRWWNKSDELDIMAVNRDKSAFLLGECKYKHTAFTSAEYKKSRAKFTPSRGDASCYYYLFSKNGFALEVLQAAKAGDCVCVALENLM